MLSGKISDSFYVPKGYESAGAVPEKLNYWRLIKLAGAVGDDYVVDLRSVAILGCELLDSSIDERLIKLLLHEVDGASSETARHLAIIERRTLRKQRTKARNEKIKTDRMAALPPKQPHDVYRNLLPDRWGSLY